MVLIKKLLKILLTFLYRVRITGLHHCDVAYERVLIVANHTSYLDALLLAAFLPGKPVFAINTLVSRHWWMQPLLKLVTVFPMDPTNPMSVKGLIRRLKQGDRVVIFPEGRITRTGSLMKVYDGAAMAADKAGAKILPIRLDGPQYTPFSRMRGRYRLRWFPRIDMSVLPAVDLSREISVTGRERRRRLGNQLTELMGQMVFDTSNHRMTLYQGLLKARKIHGGDYTAVEDIQRQPLTYNDLITRTLVLGRKVKEMSGMGESVGVLLPSSAHTVSIFFALSAFGRIPAMLNFTLGDKGLLSACETGKVRNLITSRRFVELGELTDVVERLSEQVDIHYLEDWAKEIDILEKLYGWLTARLGWIPKGKVDPDSPAVLLFTSGSEGAPKGVVLSHANLMANQAQIAARVDFSPADTVFNALPMFHSFGLTAGTLLPVLGGMRCFLYPSPLHYKVIPELVYDINATVLFGTNTFLAGYARHAHPYDFYSLRYVFAGAEKVSTEVREQWMSKFGIRVLEGYGATETSPVISVNTAMANREGTVGRFMPGIDWRLEPVAGVERGGRLHVRGPSIMSGYLLPEGDGEIVPPHDGWYDTGDIVEVDVEGFITILGRAKRFAKIGGEMVSLTVVEELASSLWREHQHAAVSLPDSRKGEQVVLLTTYEGAERSQLVEHAKRQGLGELHVPRKVVEIESMPVLGTGKTDYCTLQELAKREH